MSKDKEKTQPSRFIIEGTWKGRVVHRTVHSRSDRKLREWAELTYSLPFNDGTSLMLSVRDCKLRERVPIINGYNQYIKEEFMAYIDKQSTSPTTK